MPRIYEGERPYIFVNYAHADRGAALQIINALEREGYRVWYDVGIQAGSSFPDYIADHIHDCACFVMLVSRASLASDWCRREVYYALELHKAMLPIYLEDVELTRGLKMSIGPMQSLFWHRLELDAFYERLFGTSALYPCLDEEGKARRGVEARTDAAGDPKPLDDVTPRVVTVPSVRQKGSIADYSWADLKELSRMIAAADSDVTGLAIAKAYHLVDKDGRLQGDEKPLQLKDGTKTSVRILGFRHDELVGGGKAGISFEFTDVPRRYSMFPDWRLVGGWKKCWMRAWLNESFISLLLDDLRSNIVGTTKRTNNHGKVSSHDFPCVTHTFDKLWLLSANEVYGDFSGVYGAEGIQYQLYLDKGVPIEGCGFCAKRGVKSTWWLRSPCIFDISGFYHVRADGVWGFDPYDDDRGVSPGFCF